MSNDDSRSEPDPVPEEVSELLEERGTFLEWLERLEELRDEVRPEVYGPVAEDYRERLAGVESDLAEYRSELEAALGEREEEKEELAAELEERRRAREEARLRHRVGEYDDEQWESEREELDDRIETLQERLEREETAVEELGDVVAAVAEAARGREEREPPDAGAESPAGAVEDEPVGVDPDASADEEDEDVEEAADEGEPDVEGAAPAGAGTAGPELDPDAEQEPAAGTAPDEEEAGGGERADEESEEGYRDELQFLESLSLEDPDQFDAVSSMLDDDDGDRGRREGDGDARPGEEADEGGEGEDRP